MSVTTSGLQSKSSRRAVRHFIELVSSMRFAISLLVVLAIASIIGTVLTQEDPYPNYVNQFGPFWADIFRGVSLYNVYSAWWFMLILGFLVMSVSLCVIRNAPKMIADTKSWKDKVREGSLRAFHHKGEFAVPNATRAQAASTLGKLSTKLGYKYVTRESEGATLIAAKRGALTKLGYISAHLAIVIAQETFQDRDPAPGVHPTRPQGRVFDPARLVVGDFIRLVELEQGHRSGVDGFAP